MVVGRLAWSNNSQVSFNWIISQILELLFLISRFISSGKTKFCFFPDGDEKPLSVAEKSLLQKVLHKGLVENKYDIEIERRNPKSPLFSVKSFEALNLKPELLKVL